MCGVGLFGEADINHIICLHHILCAPTQDAVCSKYFTSDQGGRSCVGAQGGVPAEKFGLRRKF